MTTVKRIVPGRCLGAIIDVQEFFLDQTDKRLRPRLETNLQNFVRLLGYFRIPILVTLERPVEHKGLLPEGIRSELTDLSSTLEKDFFDLTKETKIRNHLARLKKKQVIVVGSETDVCVLQSCLGLLALGYEVFLVEELLFSSARNVKASIERMKDAGAVFLTYKTLFYELIEAVDGGRHADKVFQKFGAFPVDVPDAAV